MQAIFIRTTIATMVAYLGALLGLIVGGSARSRILLLVNAALGALLAVTVFDIFPDAMELLPAHVSVGGLHIPWLFLLAAGSGWGIFWLVGRYIYPVCPACSFDGHSHGTEVLGKTLVLMMIALGVHSTMDGAAVVIGDEIRNGINYPVFFAVTFHKFPEGLALCLLLIGSGYKKLEAFGWTLVIETTTELGALAALFLLRGVPHVWMGMVFANIGGGFFYLVLNAFALVKTTSSHEHGDHEHGDHEHGEHDHGAHEHGDHEHGAHDHGTPAPSRLPMLAGGAAFAITGILIFLSSKVGQ